MKAQTLVPLAAAAAAQLLVVGNIAAAFAFQQKPPVETLVTVPVVAEIEQVECVRQDPVPYEPVTYQVPLDAELQSYTEKMCDLSTMCPWNWLMPSCRSRVALPRRRTALPGIMD